MVIFSDGGSIPPASTKLNIDQMKTANLPKGKDAKPEV